MAAREEKRGNWRYPKPAFNEVGAVATGIVLWVIIVTRFFEGAWIVILLIPLIFLIFKAINRHYRRVSEELELPGTTFSKELIQQLPMNGSRKRTIIVPISQVNKISLATLDFAQALGEVRALFISDDPEQIQSMTRQWEEYRLDFPLVILENPFRSIVTPLLNYIDSTDRCDSEDVLMVVLPEFIARHWWEHLLHNQTALRIKAALLFRPGTIVINVPYHVTRMWRAKTA